MVGIVAAFVGLLIFCGVLAVFLGDDRGTTFSPPSASESTGPNQPPVANDERASEPVRTLKSDVSQEAPESAELVMRRSVIPGLKPVDVYGNFTKKGFTLEKDFFDPQQPIWRCIEETQRHRMMVEVFGRSGSDVTLVRGTFFNYSAQDTDESAADFLGYVASIPYEESQPANAKSWVLKSIGTNATATIAGVSLELIANSDAPRCRMLIIQPAGKSQPTMRPAKPSRTVPNRKEHEFRSWTDNTAQFSIEARFVSYANGKVTLEKKDGSETVVPMERLSPEDQQWVSKLRR